MRPSTATVTSPGEPCIVIGTAVAWDAPPAAAPPAGGVPADGAGGAGRGVPRGGVDPGRPRIPGK
ncbi:hypothetical protein GCM10009735_68850 [Actinomadura chokoriensis]